MSAPARPVFRDQKCSVATIRRAPGPDPARPKPPGTDREASPRTGRHRLNFPAGPLNWRRRPLAPDPLPVGKSTDDLAFARAATRDLEVVVRTQFDRGEKSRPEPFPFCPEWQGGTHAARKRYATGRNDRYVRRGIAHQHHGADSGPDMATGFDASRNDDIGPEIRGAGRFFRRRHRLDDDRARVFGLAQVRRRIAPERGRRLDSVFERSAPWKIG